MLIGTLLVVFARGSLVAHGQNLYALRQVGLASLGVHPDLFAPECERTINSVGEFDSSCYDSDAAAWASSWISWHERVSNILFWRAPGSSRRVLLLLVLVWIVYVLIGSHCFSGLLGLLFFTAPLRARIGWGGKDCRTLTRLFSAPSDAEIAMELIRQRAASASTVPMIQDAKAAGLMSAPMARLAQQSLGQSTWLAQATYTIQVDGTPLLFILGSTRLKFSQVSYPLYQFRLPLALPPPIQDQKIVLDISLDRVEMLSKQRDAQLYMSLHRSAA